jgi:hypothetical protein
MAMMVICDLGHFGDTRLQKRGAKRWSACGCAGPWVCAGSPIGAPNMLALSGFSIIRG